MSITVTQVNTAADTFQVWVDTTNEMANLFSTSTITANNDANGSLTTGNAHVNGIFSSLTIAVGTTLRGGNVQTTDVLNIGSNVSLGSTQKFSVGSSTVNSVVNSTSVAISNSTVSFIITKPTASQISSADFYLNANGSYVQIHAASISNSETSGTAAQLVDSWAANTYWACDYTITVNDNSANNRQHSKVSIIHDEGDAYLTEYAVVSTNTDVGAFTANLDSFTVRLYFTPVSSNTSVYMRKEFNAK